MEVKIVYILINFYYKNLIINIIKLLNNYVMKLIIINNFVI